MADDPNNPFARASAWPRMPNVPMQVGPLPKAEPRPPPVRSITPVFTRPVGSAPQTVTPQLAEPAPEPPPAMVVARLRSSPPRRDWMPFAIAAGIGGIVAVGSAVLPTREPEPAEPRLAAAIVEPAPAAAVAALDTAPEPTRMATVARKPRRPLQPPVPDPQPAPPAVEIGAPLEIPPGVAAEPPPAPAPRPVDPEAPIATRSPY